MLSFLNVWEGGLRLAVPDLRIRLGWRWRRARRPRDEAEARRQALRAALTRDLHLTAPPPLVRRGGHRR